MLTKYCVSVHYTYVRHPRALPSLNASAEEAGVLETALSMAPFSFAESNRAFTFPRRLIGSQLDFSSNTVFISSLYDAIHVSTSISSRPSMMAIRLVCQSSFEALHSSTYPPVLVPPIKSNTSHGLTWLRPSLWRWWFKRIMRPLRI